MLKGIKNDDHLNQLICNTNYVAQEKLDGMRAIIHICKGGLRIFSDLLVSMIQTRPLEKTSSLPQSGIVEISAAPWNDP